MRFGTVGEPNEVICQSQQDRFCLGVRSARHRARFSGTVAPIGWIVRKSEGHFRRFPESASHASSTFQYHALSKAGSDSSQYGTNFLL
jgi:hypothetical protein